MTYDGELAERLREQLAPCGPWTEQAMFGGLAFLFDGHMVLTASRTGGLMLRLDPAEAAELVDPPAVDLVQMGGRRQKRWLLVAAEGIATEDDLATWVDRAVAHAGLAR